jgi:predicted nucleic acid-binding Zn ribbon protein
MEERLGLIELGQIIKQVLERRKMWRQYRQCLIIDQWDQLVGPKIAAVTCARRIERRMLWVKVSDSTWAYHLTLLKPQLIKKINEHAGENMVQDIFFQIGTDDWS